LVRILGFDTATRQASVGLWSDGQIIAEVSGASQNHAVSLLPFIDDTLRQAGCAIGDVDAVAVSSGPGSFSGLRVGLSVAKGLACATGVRVIPVPTLAALARSLHPARLPASQREQTICTLLDAHKGELYAATFAPAAQGGERLTPDTVVTAEALLPHLPLPCLILGDAVVTYGAFLRERLGDAVTLLPFDAYAPRGGAVAALAAESLPAGAGTDATHLEPCYIRPSYAES
jgi:tRNA threonylcarbamoyladenosine biosynthesis protein TsaB